MSYYVDFRNCVRSWTIPTATILKIAIVVVSLSGCSEAGDEVARVPSPDRQMEAVVMEDSGGATTSYFYIVCIVKEKQACDRSKAVATLYGAVRNPSAYGVNLRWLDSAHLVVEYASAIRADLVEQPPYPGKEMRVQLRSGVVDQSAPPGSMSK